MARALRIIVEGGIYHVVARGNERRAIFRSERDREEFESLLGELEDRFGVEVGAYVLMDNHYHVLVRLQRPQLSQAFQWLNVTYGMRYNKRYRRSGHLFQGRFGSHLIEPESVWELARYLHLNPVRVAALKLSKKDRQELEAGIRKATREEIGQWLNVLNNYRWSSYRGSVKSETGPVWLRDGWWLEGGKRKYQQYVEEGIRYGIEETPWEKVRGQAVLGSEHFFEKMKDALKGDPREQKGLKAWKKKELIPLDHIRKGVSRTSGKAYPEWIRQYGSKERAFYFLAARQWGGARLIELAQEAGIDYAGVSHASNRLKRAMESDKELKKKWDQILSSF
jgi:putative transposase